MIAKHTPGPWKFIDATKVAGMQFAQKCVIKAGGKQIADFSWNDSSPWFPTKGESQANARLIAASPDLLEALQECEEYFDNRADADCDQDGYVPNKEMRLLQVVRDALRKAGSA